MPEQVGAALFPARSEDLVAVAARAASAVPAAVHVPGFYCPVCPENVMARVSVGAIGPVIDDVSPKSPAKRAGLKGDDRVLEASEVVCDPWQHQRPAREARGQSVFRALLPCDLAAALARHEISERDREEREEADRLRAYSSTDFTGTGGNC